MFFRNLTIFRFPESQAKAFAPVEHHERQSFFMDEPIAAQAFRDNALKPVGPLELSSNGFVPPYGRYTDDFIGLTQGASAAWFAVGSEDKLLPASVVNARLASKLDEIESREGRRPAARARKRIKDDLLHDMLPAAFVQPSRIDALVDVERGVLFVDASSRKKAESVVSMVRQAFGSFPAIPINTEVAPRSIMTAWLAGERLPGGLSIGSECELRDPIEGGAVLKCRDQELQAEEISKHLEAGKLVTQLELLLDDRLAFVLGDDLVIRKLRFLEGATDRLEDVETDDLRVELNARLHLQAGELAQLFDVLEGAVKLSKGEG